MGLFDLFKKKSEEELFQEAVSNQDYIKIVKLGENLLQEYPNNLSILNPYVDALVKLEEKEKAVQILTNFGKKKIRDEYYDIAIPVLKKALKIDPLNLKAIKLLATAYRKKELYYDAFKVLIESFKKYKEANLNTEIIKGYLEDFIQGQFHPLLYEKYADFLLEEGDKEKALVNYILAANMYTNLKNYKFALKSTLKAQKIKNNENIDKQLLEILAYLTDIEPQIINLKKLDKDGKRFISFTEALFGLGNYDEAIKIAEKAFNTEEAFKAATIITESLMKKGEEKKALSFLFDQIKNPKLSEEEKAKLKALIGKIHEKLGDRKRALVWYREANKILHDKDLEGKIEKLQSNEQV